MNEILIISESGHIAADYFVNTNLVMGEGKYITSLAEIKRFEGKLLILLGGYKKNTIFQNNDHNDIWRVVTEKGLIVLEQKAILVTSTYKLI